MSWSFLSMSLLVGVLASASTPTPSPMPAPTLPASLEDDFLGRATGGEMIDVVGLEGLNSESSSGGTASGGARVESNTGPRAGDEYFCEPVKYSQGGEWVPAINCRGELGGTERVPWLVRDDADDAASTEDDSEAIIVTREDVQSLLVDAGGLEIQPDRSWVLVNIETIAFTGAAEHILTTTVLDAPIEVRVTPVSFTWDFGDGSQPFVTADPGASWPHHTVAHTYSAVQEEAVVTVTTEWDAVFRIPGVSPWLPVVGAVVTTESSEPFEVVTATPRLVVGSG